MQIVRVALDVPLHRFFDYLAPAGDVLTAADIGLRVRVPFGRRAKIGVVVDLPEHSDLAPEQRESIWASDWRTRFSEFLSGCGVGQR